MLDTQKEREKKRRSTFEIKTAGSFFTSRDGDIIDIIVVVRAAKKRVRATSDDGPQSTKREEAKISTPPKTLFLSRDDRVGDDVFHEDGREGFLRNENHRKKEHPFCAPEGEGLLNLARRKGKGKGKGNRNLPMDTEYLLDPRIPRLKKGHKIRTTEDFEENHKA